MHLQFVEDDGSQKINAWMENGVVPSLLPFSFSSAQGPRTSRKGPHNARKEHRKEPLLRTSLLNTNAGVDLPPLSVCVLSRRTTLKQRAPWTREANFRRCGATSPCSLERLRLGRPRFDPPGLEDRTATEHKSGTGETVHLHFGGRRFTEDKRMKENGVFLPSCSFLFQAPMARARRAKDRTAHAEERETERALWKDLASTIIQRGPGPPSACRVHSETPHPHPQTTSAVDDRREFRTVRGGRPLAHWNVCTWGVHVLPPSF